MRFRFYFLVVLFVASAVAQTFQYSRGWTNGRKRSDPAVASEQLLRHRRPPVPDYKANPEDGWSHVRISDQVNEDGERLLYGVGRCVKMATSIVSAPKDDDKTDEEQAEYTIH